MKLRHPALLRLLPPLGAGLLTTLLGTCRRTIRGQEHEDRLVSRGPVIYTLWHGQLAYILYHLRHHRGVIMTSPSFDGELIGRVAEQFGIFVVHGSRHKGGREALREMAGYLARGYSAGLVADGSRGPAHVVQKGVVALARQAQVPILPVSATASRRITLKTWDAFEIPLPCSRVTLRLGEPLWVAPTDRGVRLEERRQELQARLLHLLALGQQVRG